MKHLMIDIETLGTKPGCVVLSIGAVQFDLVTGDIGGQFKVDISVKDSEAWGLQIDAETFLWWLKQSDEARKTLLNHEGDSLLKALHSFKKFIVENFEAEFWVWGNSARFDLGILDYLFDKTKVGLPWNHKKELDVRTQVFRNPKIKERYFELNGYPKHEPISDCLGQIRYCSAIEKTIKIVD